VTRDEASPRYECATLSPSPTIPGRHLTLLEDSLGSLSLRMHHEKTQADTVPNIVDFVPDAIPSAKPKKRIAYVPV